MHSVCLCLSPLSAVLLCKLLPHSQARIILQVLYLKQTILYCKEPSFPLKKKVEIPQRG